MLTSFLVKISIKNEHFVGFKANFSMTVNNKDPIPCDVQDNQ